MKFSSLIEETNFTTLLSTLRARQKGYIYLLALAAPERIGSITTLAQMEAKVLGVRLTTRGLNSDFLFTPWAGSSPPFLMNGSQMKVEMSMTTARPMNIPKMDCYQSPGMVHSRWSRKILLQVGTFR